MRQSSEPSVEEILDSIKKVIARDNRASAAVERKERAERGVKAVAADQYDEDDVFELDASAELIEDHTAGALLPEGSASSMRESLAALAMLAEPGASPQIVRSGETSLEGLTRELLRPALADWLDKNLPPLVERMVATEIARIVGKKG
jgi:cell pole-organizing protein PopZ